MDNVSSILGSVDTAKLAHSGKLMGTKALVTKTDWNSTNWDVIVLHFEASELCKVAVVFVFPPFEKRLKTKLREGSN